MKDSIILTMTDTKEKFAAFEKKRITYVNEEVGSWVTKKTSLTRIVPWKGRLVQKTDPIYFLDHRPNNPFDFTANFYSPTKHFLGRKYDTLYFNIAIIWSFSILFYATLYFQVLRKIVNSFELRRKYLWKSKD